MTTTRSFRWDDAGAPVIEGVVGSFSSAMTLLLVGSAGVAYGSGPGQKLAAGWTVAYTGTNKVALRNSLAAGGTGCYLRIVDNGSTAGGAKEALIQVYESMTDVDTGVRPASSNASSAGVYIKKSEAASAGARPWIIVADERTVYFSVYANSSTLPAAAANVTASTYNTLGGAGDFDPEIPGDPAVFVAARDISNATQYAANSLGIWRRNFIGTNQGFAISRDNTLTASPTACHLAGFTNTFSVTDSGAWGGSTAPMASDIPGIPGSTLCAPAWLQAESGIRGRMRGLYIPLNAIYSTRVLGDTMTPLGAPAGSSMVVLSGLGLAANSTNNCARLLVETDLSWD